ncbi:MAG TPA: class F sortase [Bacillota bacterium]|nr:class F sortase [Bacillota bacterium]
MSHQDRRRFFRTLMGLTTLGAVVGCAPRGEAVRAPGTTASPPGRAHSSRSSSPATAIPQSPEEIRPARSAATERSTPSSPPVSLGIPDIGVSAEVMRLDLQPDGSMEVPPFDRADEAGWYIESPAPGQIGPVVIVGHIDAPGGPAVFYRLADLRPGQSVHLTCDDGRKVTYRAERIQLFPKEEFPTHLVYGDLDYPGIRLITCGGAYQRAAGGYQGNIVVFGRIHDS